MIPRDLQRLRTSSATGGGTTGSTNYGTPGDFYIPARTTWAMHGHLVVQVDSGWEYSSFGVQLHPEPETGLHLSLVVHSIQTNGDQTSNRGFVQNSGPIHIDIGTIDGAPDSDDIAISYSGVVHNDTDHEIYWLLPVLFGFDETYVRIRPEISGATFTKVRPAATVPPEEAEGIGPGPLTDPDFEATWPGLQDWNGELITESFWTLGVSGNRDELTITADTSGRVQQVQCFVESTKVINPNPDPGFEYFAYLQPFGWGGLLPNEETGPNLSFTGNPTATCEYSNGSENGGQWTGRIFFVDIRNTSPNLIWTGQVEA